MPTYTTTHRATQTLIGTHAAPDGGTAMALCIALNQLLPDTDPMFDYDTFEIDSLPLFDQWTLFQANADDGTPFQRPSEQETYGTWSTEWQILGVQSGILEELQSRPPLQGCYIIRQSDGLRYNPDTDTWGDEISRKPTDGGIEEVIV